MGEAIGHEILNHLGQVITVPRSTLRFLDRYHFLRRDIPSGLLQFKPELTYLYLEMEHDRVLGPDFSGPNVCFCKCDQCKAKLYQDPEGNGGREDDHTEQLVRRLKAQRKYA